MEGLMQNDRDGVSAARNARADGPFHRTIDVAKKYVVSSTLDRGNWEAELIREELGNAVQQPEVGGLAYAPVAVSYWGSPANER